MGLVCLGRRRRRVLTNSQLGPPWSGDIMYSRAEGGTGEEEEQDQRSCLGEDVVVRQGLVVVGLGIFLLSGVFWAF